MKVKAGNDQMIGSGPGRRMRTAGETGVWAARAGAWAAQAAGMYLMSRAHLLGELSPFAPAAMAAGMAAGMNPAAMLIGAAAGAWGAENGLTGWIPAFSCLIVCALGLTAIAAERRFEKIGEMKDFLTGAAAGLGLLIPGLAASGGLPYNVMTACLSSAAAMFLAPALISGMGVRGGRTRLMPEEQLSLSLLMMTALIGLRAVPGGGLFLSQTAAALVTLVFSGAGAAMGALAGLAAGTALTLGGSDPFIGSALGLCGLLAGCVKKLPRIGAGVAFMLGNLMTVSWGVGYSTGAVQAWAALTGCAAYCLVPENVLSRLRGWMEGGYPSGDAENLAVRMRQKAGRKLSGISEIFGELADGYGEESILPGEQQIISEVRHALCDGCAGYADCWMGDHAQAGRLMCRMAAEALSGREITRAADLPPDLIRHCRRSSQIDRRAVPLLARLAKERRESLKRGEARSVTGRQFREAQRLLDALSTQLQGGICVNRQYADLVHAALDRAGMAAKEITVLLDDRMEIICTLRDGICGTEEAWRAAQLLTDELGVPFSPVMSRGRTVSEFELHLRQAPALTAAFHAVSCAAEEGECGDSHIVSLLPDGRLIAALSDGMGQGARAAQESARCISLLRKFVSAGVDREAALAAVNSLLVMRDDGDMFATADLCVVDLYSGAASWSKLGACSSYIVSDRGMKRIAGGRLPLGIIDQVEPATERIEVHPGDLIIMISDGIADEMKEGQAGALEREIRKVRHMKPEQAAGAILDWAKKRDAGKDRDDMTVIAARILARRIRKG